MRGRVTDRAYEIERCRELEILQFESKWTCSLWLTTCAAHAVSQDSLVDRLVASWPAADAYASSLPLMSHWAYCVAPAALYLLSVSGLRRVMRSRVAPIDVPTWFQALHNLALVLLSAFMASALLWQALRLGYGVICNRVVEGPLGKPVRMHPHLLHVTHERKISFFFFF
jgi:hypothetical protein